MSVIRKHALVVALAAGLSQTVPLSQSPQPSTEASFAGDPAVVLDWASRLLASDPKVRATAEAALVRGRSVRCPC